MTFATRARKGYKQTNNTRASTAVTEDGGTAAATDAENEFNEMTDFFVSFVKDSADSASAGASTDLVVAGYFPSKTLVVNGYFTPRGATSTVATQYATLTLERNDGAGSTDIAIGTMSTQSTAFAFKTRRSFTITGANATIPSGHGLYLSITKTGAGRKVPAGTVTVHCRKV